MTEVNSYSDLRELEWINIPGVDYVLKYKFFDEGYSILVTNLKEIFGECVSENELQQRFSEQNVHAKMKTSIIIRNLKETLDTILVGNESILDLDYSEDKVRIPIQFCVNRASLSYYFEARLLSLNQLRSHILVPTISHALLTYQENMALKKRIKQLENKLKLESVTKDFMLDYKKNLNAFNLMINTNVSETVILDSFLTVQKDIQACISDRKKVIELQQNNLSENPDASRILMKKEALEPSLPIQYDEENGEENMRNSLTSPLLLPAKREISESSDLSQNVERNITQICNNIPSHLEKTKKKKSFKF